MIATIAGIIPVLPVTLGAAIPFLLYPDLQVALEEYEAKDDMIYNPFGRKLLGLFTVLGILYFAGVALVANDFFSPLGPLLLKTTVARAWGLVWCYCGFLAAIFHYLYRRNA